MEEKGVIAVCESLKRISSLKCLDLSYNIINGEAVNSLAAALSNNASLECLDLTYCTWPDNGSSMIQSVLINLKIYEKLNSSHGDFKQALEFVVFSSFLNDINFF